MSRVNVVESNEFGLSQIANLLGMEVVGEPRVGFRSSGVKVVGYQEQWFLRQPCLNGDDPSTLLKAYQNTGAKGVARVMVVGTEGTIKEIGYDSEDPKWGEVRQLGEVRAVAMLLHLLPEGESLTEVMDQDNYRAFGQALRAWHDHSISLTEEQADQWRYFSAIHPVEGNERLLAIQPYINFSEGWMLEDDFHLIEHLMREEAARQVDDRAEVKRVHGDSWRDNVLITLGGEAVLFDSAVKYGVAANDIAFAIGDRVVAWLVNGDGGARGMAEAFLEGYGQQNLMQDVFVGLGFKAVVGAAFDGYEDKDRKRIIGWVKLMLSKKRDNTNLEFSLDQAKEIWDESAAN